MDSIHQGPHFIPGSIQQGRALSDAQLAQLEAHPKAAGVQQLCFFHPDENKHITSGVTRTDLKQLENASEGLSRNNPPIIGDLLVTKARNILIANGINHRNFSPEQQIHLAHLLGQGIVSGDWAHAINSALANGNLTADLVDSIIHAKIKGWEVVLDIVHSAVGNNADLSALNASEKHQLAGLLLHEQSPISGDWIQRHAEALAAGGITHTDFQAILAKAKESADTAALEAADAKKLKDIAPKVDDKKKVDDAPPLHEKGFAHAFKQHVSGFHSMSASWHTYIASRIAQQVIGEDGKVDDAAIARMREDVQSDTFRQTGPKDPQRAHVLAMLDALESNDQGMRDILESISAPQNPATSKAAEKIKSTLGLPRKQ